MPTGRFRSFRPSLGALVPASGWLRPVARLTLVIAVTGPRLPTPARR